MKRQNEKSKNINGVVSLEACIVLPIFVFLILFFYGFMYMFAGQQLVNHALIQSAVSLSLDSYAADKFDDNTEIDKFLNDTLDYAISKDKVSHASGEKWYENDKDIPDEIKKRFYSYLANGNNEYAAEKLQIFGVENLSFGECKVDGKGRNMVLEITVKYKQRYLMDAFDSGGFDREYTIKQKMW